MKRRILQIVPTLHRAGAEKQLSILSCSLAAAGEFDVHVCAVSQDGAEDGIGARERARERDRQALEIRSLGLVATAKAHRRAQARSCANLAVHGQRLRPGGGAFGRRAADRGQRAVRRRVEGAAPIGRRSVPGPADRRDHRQQPGRRGVLQTARNPRRQAALIYNGIGPAAPSETSRADLLTELNLPPGTRLIGAVGRLWPQKRVKDLIWAADLLKVISDDVHLLVIGDGPQRAALERYRRLCHIEDRVHFLGARHDVPRLMPHFDVLWLASGFEGLPNTIMEAMSCGVPVVASDIWGNRELVVHGETGFLVPTGDRASLARYAYKILQDPALAARLGAAGKQRIEAEFTIQAMVDKHVALYRELMG